jgi:nicotinamide-nucleotide amidase
MKTAAIISVGTEIMRGKIDDTNSTFIARFLKDCGIRLRYRFSVEDEIEDIVSAIGYAQKADLVILTGGLGPTDDDITREALAEFLGKKLVFQESQWNLLTVFFQRFNRPIADSNRKQADLIEGAEFIGNENGTAPGMLYNRSGKLFVLLPGPPRENQPMIKGGLYEMLKREKFIEGEIYTRIFRLYNVGESTIADLFKDFKEDIQLGYYFSANGWVEIHFSRFITDRSRVGSIEDIVSKGLKIIDDNNIFRTPDVDLSKIVYGLLLEKGKTVSFAESVTGGALSGELVRNPGVSKMFNGSVVSYSNEMKQNVLGVGSKSLSDNGAVSAKVAEEMALGLKKITGSDICVSVTGIAGPEGGSAEKPVGLVYFGFLFDGEMTVKKEIFGGNRQQIINRIINFTFTEILKHYD